MNTTQTIVWVHGDCLRPNNPAIEIHRDAPALFVWDEQLLQHYDISLKRIVFMYECLLEMPVTIRKGDVVRELVKFAAEYGATVVATTQSPSPLFERYSHSLERQGLNLLIHEDIPFVSYSGRIDLKRFSRYWRTVEQYAFK